jgi:hypothetical protein
MTQPGSAHRITVLLDTRVSLESLVLNRLRCLPETRRDEWLRGLLMLGFRRECQAINHEQSNTTVGEGLGFPLLILIVCQFSHGLLARVE